MNQAGGERKSEREREMWPYKHGVVNKCKRRGSMLRHQLHTNRHDLQPENMQHSLRKTNSRWPTNPLALQVTLHLAYLDRIWMAFYRYMDIGSQN